MTERLFLMERALGLPLICVTKLAMVCLVKGTVMRKVMKMERK